MKFLFASILTAISMIGFADAAQAAEMTVYTCDGFHSEGQGYLLGQTNPQIVRLTDDDSGGKTLYVRTTVLHPNAKPKYQELTLKHVYADASFAESETFEVSFMSLAGLRAQIKVKGTELVANCHHVNTKFMF